MLLEMKCLYSAVKQTCIIYIAAFENDYIFHIWNITASSQIIFNIQWPTVLGEQFYDGIKSVMDDHIEPLSMDDQKEET